MVAKPVAFMLAELGVTKSHSRPHVSKDNPFSEADFRTLKYRPEFLDRFGSFTHAAQHCETFFAWYNLEHRHSGIGLHTPFDVHHVRAATVRAQRQVVLDTAYAAHPERFVRRPPVPPALPDTLWIDKPTLEPRTTQRFPKKSSSESLTGAVRKAPEQHVGTGSTHSFGTLTGGQL